MRFELADWARDLDRDKALDRIAPPGLAWAGEGIDFHGARKEDMKVSAGVVMY